MTSCLKDTVQDILGQAKAIPFAWSSDMYKSQPAVLFQKVLMWNDQVRRAKSGKGYVFESPACFLEIQNNNNSSFLDNVTMSEPTWRLHIVHMELDAGNESDLDQNLNVITYRDSVKQALCGYQPVNCSTLFAVDERQDYEHDDVYHYILDLKSCFVDTKGSSLDPDQTVYIYTTPPTNLELIAQFDNGITPPADPVIVYTWKTGEIRVTITDTPNPANTQTLFNGVVIPVEYALNLDGSLTIPYLANTPGHTVLTPFVMGGFNIPTILYDLAGTFSNPDGGGFDGDITFNASLPML